jgi:hypothetical protein
MRYLHDDTPHLIHSQLANTSAGGSFGTSKERLLEAGSDDQSKDSSSELTNTLHGENSVHHGSSPFRGSEFGCDDTG